MLLSLTVHSMKWTCDNLVACAMDLIGHCGSAKPVAIRCESLCGRFANSGVHVGNSNELGPFQPKYEVVFNVYVGERKFDGGRSTMGTKDGGRSTMGMTPNHLKVNQVEWYHKYPKFYTKKTLNLIENK